MKSLKLISISSLNRYHNQLVGLGYCEPKKGSQGDVLKLFSDYDRRLRRFMFSLFFRCS